MVKIRSLDTLYMMRKIDSKLLIYGPFRG